MKVAVVYNEPILGKPDSEDVLEEVNFVTNTLKTLNYEFKTFTIGHNIIYQKDIHILFKQLLDYSPNVIFNLVESIAENQKYYPIIGALFEILGIPYTGSRFETLHITTDKTLAKAILYTNGLLTPNWISYRYSHEKSNKDYKIDINFPVILKPSFEDASVGIEESSVCYDEKSAISKLFDLYTKYPNQAILIEEYIDGRELNVSLLEREDRSVEVMPPAEMLFINWPNNKPKIVDYKAKWVENSFEYDNTIRTFNIEGINIEKVKETALQTWDLFNLRGYARIDMRVDKEGNIFVIEVNTNPCIAPYAGFIMATKQRGYEETEVIKKILDSAFQNR